MVLVCQWLQVPLFSKQKAVLLANDSVETRAQFLISNTGLVFYTQMTAAKLVKHD